MVAVSPMSVVSTTGAVSMKTVGPVGRVRVLSCWEPTGAGRDHSVAERSAIPRLRSAIAVVP